MSGPSMAAVRADAASLYLDPVRFDGDFDQRPLGFEHDLARLDLFTFDSLLRLAEHYHATPRDYFVAAGAPAPGAVFDSVPRDLYAPREAMNRLDAGPLRILLKRPENHDPRFRALLEDLMQQVQALRPGLADERIVRHESAVFITSARATTPFHFDPEIAFFAQIAGDKEYHVYEPAVLTEPELERFYMCDMISVGQVALAGRDPAREHVFVLGPGEGLHQPQNAPHWVVTRGERSISYTFVFETEAGRTRGRAHCCNHYLRKLGLLPRGPGHEPALDRAKAATMRALLPLRPGMRSLLRPFAPGHAAVSR